MKISETILSGLLLLCLTLLRYERAIDERTFLIGLIVWAFITPSPSQWVIMLGDWLKARKNGKTTVEVGKEGEDNGTNQPEGIGGDGEVKTG